MQEWTWRWLTQIWISVFQLVCAFLRSLYQVEHIVCTKMHHRSTFFTKVQPFWTNLWHVWCRCLCHDILRCHNIPCFQLGNILQSQLFSPFLSIFCVIYAGHIDKCWYKFFVYFLPQSMESFLWYLTMDFMNIVRHGKLSTWYALFDTCINV